MKTFKILLLGTLAIFLFNCSSNDDTNIPSGSFVKNMNENPLEGVIIGTITTSGGGNTNYIIETQSPSNAMRIDAMTGRLIVEDPTAFDFETNPEMTAVVIDLESDARTNVTINLNNVDDIASFLTTSKADYLATEESEWVIITEEEYNTLMERLNDVSTLGTTTQDYQTAGASSIDNVTVTNVAGCPNLPENNYFFGFKYHSFSDNVVGARVRMSMIDPLEGFFIGWGNTLPTHGMGDNYFVIKSNFSGGPVETDAYVALHSPKNLGYREVSTSQTSYGNNGDTDNFPEANIATGYIYLYQGLYTSQKQWE